MKKFVLSLLCTASFVTSAIADQTCQAKKVWMIWSDDCVFCHQEEKFLQAHGIPFERIQDGTQRARDIPHWGTPVTVIEGSFDGKSHYIEGFDEGLLRKFLCIRK